MCVSYVTKKRDGNKSNCRGLTEMTVKRQACEIWNESNPSVLHNARPPYSPIRIDRISLRKYFTCRIYLPSYQTVNLWLNQMYICVCLYIGVENINVS